MIDYYERRAGNPSLDFIQRAAEALDVSVAELLGSQPKATRGKPGPTPQLQLRFDQIRRLPRKEQEFVIRFIDTVLEKLRRHEVTHLGSNAITLYRPIRVRGALVGDFS